MFVVAGRYPWGMAASEDDTDHSQLATLRRFLLTDGLLALKQARDLRRPPPAVLVRAASTTAQSTCVVIRCTF